MRKKAAPKKTAPKTKKSTTKKVIPKKTISKKVITSKTLTRKQYDALAHALDPLLDVSYGFWYGESGDLTPSDIQRYDCVMSGIHILHQFAYGDLTAKQYERAMEALRYSYNDNDEDDNDDDDGAE